MELTSAKDMKYTDFFPDPDDIKQEKKVHFQGMESGSDDDKEEEEEEDEDEEEEEDQGDEDGEDQEQEEDNEG